VRFEEAMTILGLHASESDRAAVRTAYMAALRRHHPDLNPDSGATEMTARITSAYRLVCDVLDDELATRPASTRSGAPPPPPPRPRFAVHETPPPYRPYTDITIAMISDDTIELGAPPDIAFAFLVQTAHQAGDVTYLDRSAAMLQLVVNFVNEPACQIIFDLQGRAARGTTEVFCTIESMEDRPAPPIGAVTRFLADQLQSAAT